MLKRPCCGRSAPFVHHSDGVSDFGGRRRDHVQEHHGGCSHAWVPAPFGRSDGCRQHPTLRRLRVVLLPEAWPQRLAAWTAVGRTGCGEGIRRLWLSQATLAARAKRRTPSRQTTRSRARLRATCSGSATSSAPNSARASTNRRGRNSGGCGAGSPSAATA